MANTNWAPVHVAEQLRLVFLDVRELVAKHGFAVDPRDHHPLRETTVGGEEGMVGKTKKKATSRLACFSGG